MNPSRPYSEFPYIEHNREFPTDSQPFDPQLHLQPTFDFSQPADHIRERELQTMPRKLYLVPTRDDYPGSEYDRDLANTDESDLPPLPTPSAEEHLPDLEEWVTRFTYSVVEIWNGKRPAMQLARWSHRRVFATLVSQVGAFSPPPKIRRVHIHQPIEGVAESVVLLRIGNRVRSLILRFEGVDQRWVCTQLWLL